MKPVSCYAAIFDKRLRTPLSIYYLLQVNIMSAPWPKNWWLIAEIIRRILMEQFPPFLADVGDSNRLSENSLNHRILAGEKREA